MQVWEKFPSLNPKHLEDLTSPEHYSCFINEHSYSILIMRRIEVTSEGSTLTTNSFILSQDECYLFNPEQLTLEKLAGGLKELCELLEGYHEQNRTVIDHYIEELDKLEDLLFERTEPRFFMDIWFDLKKDLTRFERYFLRNLGVLKDFFRGMQKHPNFSENLLNDILDSVANNHLLVQNQLSKLDGLHNYYTSVKNDRLNKNILSLTIISAIFLPLNLIVGFFGMNTKGLFLEHHESGTKIVLMVLVTSFVISLIGFKLVKVVDQYLLRFFFKRYDMYRNVSDRIENFLKLD